MTNDMESRLRDLEAVNEIKNLQAVLCYVLDVEREREALDRESQVFVDLFADEFSVDWGNGIVVTDKAEMQEWFKGGMGHLASVHIIATPMIQVEGDKATGIWHLFGPFTNATPEGRLALLVQGKYEMEFVRQDGQWKIRNLKCVPNIVAPHKEGWA